MPAPTDADLPRERTEQWARAIYEDQSAGEKVEELRYRTACYGRTSPVLRDGPEVVAGPAMRPDSPRIFPLADNAVRIRLKVLTPLDIPFTMIADAHCRECKDHPL